MPDLRSALHGVCASSVAVLAGALLGACGAQVPGPTTAPATAAAPTAPAPGAGSVARPLDQAPADAAPPQPGVRVRPAGPDRIDVDKCWTNATATTGGQLLVSARSTDRSARLLAYRADGTLIGEVHNGGGQRYGGTVFAWQATDPVRVTVRSSSGGSVTVPTAPFRPES